MSAIMLPQILIAEEKLSTADIKNDLLKASLGGKSSDPAIANKTITETDLEIANKKLLAAEARLLEKANLSPAAINPQLPRNSDTQEAQPEIREKDIKIVAKSAVVEPATAPLDINKVIAAIDRTQNGIPEKQTQTQQQEVSRESELEKLLADANQKNIELSKELDDTRNRLMIAETQVERLSSIIDTSGKNKNSGYSANDANIARSMARSRPVQKQESSESYASDMQIAVVTADKVHLRTGPGKENSPLMAVTKGTRLAVETKNGDWYRVIAPTGARAWVSSDVISFSTADKIKSVSKNQVVGFDSTYDTVPF